MYSNPQFSEVSPPAPRRRRRRRRRFPLLRGAVVLAAVVLLIRFGIALLPEPAGPVPPASSAQEEDLAPALEALILELPEAEPLREQENYPRELLELALRNQEALDFVLNWPEEKDRPPADRVDGVTKGSSLSCFNGTGTGATPPTGTAPWR